MIDTDLDEATPRDSLVDPAIRLFSFLDQAQQLKNAKVHDLMSYKRGGAVHWPHSFPQHPVVLTIDRVARLDPPIAGLSTKFGASGQQSLPASSRCGRSCRKT